MNNDTIIAIAEKTNDLINLLKVVKDEDIKLETKSKLIEERNKTVVEKENKLSREKMDFNREKEIQRLIQEDFIKSHQQFIEDQKLLNKRKESFDILSKELIIRKEQIDKESARSEIKKEELTSLWEKEKAIKIELDKIEKENRQIAKEKAINREHKEMLDAREERIKVKEARLARITGE